MIFVGLSCRSSHQDRNRASDLFFIDRSTGMLKAGDAVGKTEGFFLRAEIKEMPKERAVSSEVLFVMVMMTRERWS